MRKMQNGNGSLIEGQLHRFVLELSACLGLGTQREAGLSVWVPCPYHLVLRVRLCIRTSAMPAYSIRRTLLQ